MIIKRRERYREKAAYSAEANHLKPPFPLLYPAVQIRWFLRLIRSIFSSFARFGLHSGARKIRPILLLTTLFFWEDAQLNRSYAELRLCNKTTGPVGAAVGYYDGEHWVTEGWWNLPKESCQVLIPGNLKAQYYYMHAVDYTEGGAWSGSVYLCARALEFKIKGTENCFQRGFEKLGFFEIDTQMKESWTVQLMESVSASDGLPREDF